MAGEASMRKLSGQGLTSQRTREKLVVRLRDRGISDEAVLEAVAQTPRHLFVDEALAGRAYEDTALPIGYGQTISQPYVVALMTEALLARVGRGKVLEIGTGCGYQTSILARVVRQVVSIERIRPLVLRAREVLRLQSIMNVLTVHGDGYLGWPAEAPFDAILITAAPPGLPEALLDQLKPGGVMILPVGESGMQRLQCWRRQEEGEPLVEDLGAVSFVPLLHGKR